MDLQLRPVVCGNIDWGARLDGHQGPIHGWVILSPISDEHQVRQRNTQQGIWISVLNLDLENQIPLF